MERDNETKREDDGEEGQDALTPLETAIGAMISEIARAALLRGDDRPVVMTITFAKPGGKDSPPTSPGGDGRDTRIEVFRVDSRVILQVGLPGADPGTLHIGFGGGHIRIMARCGSVVVRTGAPVPPPEPGDHHCLPP